MIFKKLIFFFILSTFSLSWAEEQKEKSASTLKTTKLESEKLSRTSKQEPPAEKPTLTSTRRPEGLSLEAVFQYKNDRLRKKINNDQTNITDLEISYLHTLKKDESVFMQFLGEDASGGSQGLNLNIGELYYDKKELYSFLFLRAGLMKVNYGILNEIDGRFNLLPSYYKFLYVLPRGIDMGLTLKAKLLSYLFVGSSAYLGKTARTSDSFQPKIKRYPLHFFLELKPSYGNQSLRFHFFEREFDKNPYVSAFGLDYSIHLKYKKFRFDLLSEAWSFRLNPLPSQFKRGLSFMLLPKLSYDFIYIKYMLSKEYWNSGSLSQRETLSSIFLGFNLSKYVSLELEHFSQEDKFLQKERSFQIRSLVHYSF